MDKFTVEEINLMCVFEGQDRTGMIADIKNVIPHIQDRRPLKNILFFDIKFLRHVKNPPVLNELMDFCNSDRDFLYFKRYYSLIFHLSA